MVKLAGISKALEYLIYKKKDFVNSFQTVQWFSLVYILNKYFGTRSREII